MDHVSMAFRWRFSTKVAGLVLLAMLLAAGVLTADAAERKLPGLAFTLTLLHHNDGQSSLLADGPFGGAARFSTLAHELKEEALLNPHRNPLWHQGAVMVSTGDNFLAGAEWNASLEHGIPFYDAVAMELIGYDAITLGNHDFDFGPDVLREFILSFSNPLFLSANLDFRMEPGLQELFDAGGIAKSTIVVTGGRSIGIIGATTKDLPFLSSPRNVKVDPVMEAVQAQVNQLLNLRVNIIILVSHLRGLDADLKLISSLHGIDVVVSGGGSELLANQNDLLIPGDEDDVMGAYPQYAMDATGRQIPVVTCPGGYRYIGRFVAVFDILGNIVKVLDSRSGPRRVSGVPPDAVARDPLVVEMVTEPVKQSVDGLASQIVGFSQVELDGVRARIRKQETNLGDLMADAILWQARQVAKAFDLPSPDVALQNGGGIRNNDVRGPGEISKKDTFDIAPFSSFVTLVPHIPRDQFKDILENAYSAVASSSGRFAQVSGFEVVVDLAQEGRDPDNPEAHPGRRVRDLVLNDGTVIVMDGEVFPGPGLNVATLDFLAGGGDQYPFGDASFTQLGISYQQALSNYMEQGLGGVITADQYPEGGEGRIVILGP
ncbi:MAG: bifunctional metallophosphatase/5'-nucleotidase [Deltaproteobacteria bacterium]|jgi:5'-nucleotidase / UDP-sugar diphosphatase|nr:bifunctional metallophosphatase/5'-nucleotidase [Deltaproteobacteria bacterium]